MRRSFRSFAAAAALIAAGALAGSYFRGNPASVLPAAGAATASAGANGFSNKPKPENATTRIVRHVSPSIITVGVQKKTVTAQPWFDNFLVPRMRYQTERQRIPYMGSGFIVSEDGWAITNYHVIDDSESIFVTTSDGREYPAKLIEADSFIDIALLKIDAKGETLPPPLLFADSDALQIGEDVVAFGNPFGNLLEDSRPTVTVGYVSALNRSFRPDPRNQRVYTDMIQTDAAINPGNSGGPLVDANGDVVGVNSFIFTPSGGSVGIGFAIPSARVKAFLDEVRQFGRLRPLLLDFDFRSARGRTYAGARVFETRRNGPAEAAGLQPGDIIIEADKRTVTSADDFYLLFASRQVGDSIRMKILREGEIFETDYKIGEAKEK